MHADIPDIEFYVESFFLSKFFSHFFLSFFFLPMASFFPQKQVGEEALVGLVLLSLPAPSLVPLSPSFPL